MKPLSTLNYTRNNVTKTLPVLISVIVGVFLIHFFSLVSSSSWETVKLVGNKLHTKYTFVYTNNSQPLPQKLISDIKAHGDTRKIIPLLEDVGSLYYSSVFGSMTFNTLNLYEKDIPEVMNTLDLKLIEGTLPRENSNEIVIPQKYAKQAKVRVGDFIGREVSSKYSISGKYKITGISDGSSLVSFISSNKRNISYDDSSDYSFLLVNSNKSFIREIISGAFENAVIIDFETVEKQWNEILQLINVFCVALDAIIILVLCISLGNLNYISFLNRKYEFGVLTAIGYKKSSLYLKLWKENSLVCLAGYIGGVLLSTLVCYIINITVWEAEGKFVPLWSTSGVLLSFTIPVFVSLFGLLPPVKELRRTNPIEIIDGIQ